MKLSYRNQISATAISRVWNKSLDKPDWYKINASSGDDAEILIYDVIGWPFNDAGELVRAISDMGDRHIKARINSPGGDVVDAIAIYMAFKKHGNVTTVIDSLAASAAGVIVLGGKKVHAYSSSTFMVHEPWGITIGNVYAHEESKEILEHYSSIMVDVYAENSNIGKREVKQLMGGDGKRDGTWLNAKQAKEKGFIDTILDGNGAKAQFDLSMFANTPDELIPTSNDGRELTEREIERALRDAGASRSFAKAYIADKNLRDAGLIGAAQNLLSIIEGVQNHE